MTGGSRRGRWERVLAARRQAREALGRDPDASDPFSAPTKPKSHLPAPPKPSLVPSDPSTTQYVLTLGEAATRLGLSRAELEAMIAAGKVEVLPMGLTRAIPTREINRLANVPSDET